MRHEPSIRSKFTSSFAFSDYQFTNAWFQGLARSVWDQLIPQIQPRKVLEIRSFESASAC